MYSYAIKVLENHLVRLEGEIYNNKYLKTHTQSEIDEMEKDVKSVKESIKLLKSKN